MPFFATHNNLKKVFTEHLRSGEEILVVTKCGSRGALGITSMQRVIRCSFPFFGKSKIKEEFTIADISYCECSQIKPFHMQLNLLVRGEKKHYKSIISHLNDAKTLTNTFVGIVLKYNPSAKAPYLDKDEDILEQFAASEQNIKFSHKNVFMFSRDNELENKIPMANFTQFDIYPGKFASTYLYFKTKDGNESLIKFATVRNQPSLTLHNNHQEVFANVHKILTNINPNAAPSYLQGEEVITALCAGTSTLNVMKSTHVLKLTTNRLLDLSANEDGSLQLDSEILLADIKQLRVFRLGERYSRNNIREIKIVMQDKKKIKYILNGEFGEEIQQLKRFMHTLKTN